MMKVLLEDFVPYDQSLRWQLHDAYFAQRGTAAWTDGDLPYFGMNNPVMVRQHALFLLALTRELEASGRLAPDAEVWLLEIGAGLGQFAANLFHVLRTRCGARGRRLAPRLRYVLSDYSKTSLAQASRSLALRPLVAEGRVIPGLFDLRHPHRLLDLARRPLEAQPLTAVVANYVCCASPVRIVRKRRDALLERHIRLEVDVPGVRRRRAEPDARLARKLLANPTRSEQMQSLDVLEAWLPLDLEARFGDALHVRALQELFAGHERATFAYPHLFLECLRGLAPRMLEGGVALVNDYGSSEPDELREMNEPEPAVYGNSLAHDIHFSVFDAFGRNAGLDVTRTRDPLRSIHTAVLRYGAPLGRPLRTAFRKALIDREDGEDMIDLSAAAQSLTKSGEWRLAARLYQRCLKHAPEDAELLYRLGECCIESGYYCHALRLLRKGARRDEAREWDFEALIARARRELRDKAREGI
jgi:hypothetical protein